jgi:UDP-N-acetyl-D-galactosamine dehydrogenase
MGLTFKENCPDLRNTRVVDIIEELTSYGANIEVYDPWADPDEARAYYGVTMIDTLPVNHYDGVVLAVAHREFMQLGKDDFKRICRQLSTIYDVKHALPDGVADGTL